MGHFSNFHTEVQRNGEGRSVKREKGINNALGLKYSLGVYFFDFFGVLYD